MTDTNSAPTILRISIKRFRGVREMIWKPGPGVNMILGGGDVGKTTILDAIGLLFSPVGQSGSSDTDYFRRQVEEGFEIEAVMSLPARSTIDKQVQPSWPWAWNGEEPEVPSLENDPTEPVYRLRIRGTEDLEVVYEVLQPDGSTAGLSVALRRAIGLVRLGGDDRNDRDLRLVHGSALDRLLSDKTLRSRLASELAKSEVERELAEPAQEALVELDGAFREQGLPAGLGLAITGGQSTSIAALIGLTAEEDGVSLPLASWGAGTRRLSALVIAEQKHGEQPITLVDELERGLEPYRVIALVEKLQTGGAQSFVTTHSPTAIASASEASFWYVDHLGRIGTLDPTKIARHRVKDPQAFLSRLAIVAEGATEVGFVTSLLERALDGPLTRLGVHVSDGGGHEGTLELLEGLKTGGLRFGGFADNEGGAHPTRWGRLEEALGPLLFRWTNGCLEENVIPIVPALSLETLMVDPEGRQTGMRRSTLAKRLGITANNFAEITTCAGDQLHRTILEAALGVVPEGLEEDAREYKAHAGIWFKSVTGGREIADKLFSLGLWGQLKPHLLPFCNAVRSALGLPAIEDLPA